MVPHNKQVNVPTSSRSTSTCEVKRKSTVKDNSPQRDANQNKSSDEMNKKRNTLLAKFFISCNLDFKNVSSIHCKNLFQAFDQNYKLPSFEELKNKAVLDAYIQEQNEKTNLTYLPYMSLLTYENEEWFDGICLAYNSKGEYVFIDFISECKLDGIDVKEKLELLCDRSVRKVYELSNVRIICIIYDGSFTLNQNGKVNDIHYARTACLSVVLEQLIKLSKSKPYVSVDDCKHIHNFKEKFALLEKCSLGEAINQLFEAFFGIESVRNMIISIKTNNVSAIASAANYLNPTFRGFHFLEYPPLYNTLTAFFQKYLSEDALNALKMYKNEEKIFKVLKTRISNPEIFWHEAKSYDNNLSSLADYALQLIDIPAVTKKINMDDYLNIQFELYVGRMDRKTFDIAIQLMLDAHK